MPVAVRCLRCGRAFERPPSVVALGFGKYCSNLCRYAAVRERPKPGRSYTECVCVGCGVRFMAPAWGARRTRFHTRACWYAFQRARTLATEAQRFWARVQKGEGCWLWQAATNNGGYGSFGRGQDRGGSVEAHRFSWELAHGAIPAGRYVLHHCDQRRCVNLGHLFLGTQSDNMADMLRKGRGGIGERAHHARLTWVQAREVRRRYALGGTTQYRLAAAYGVSPGAIGRLVRGETWKEDEFEEANRLLDAFERERGGPALLSPPPRFENSGGPDVRGR